MNTGQLSIGGGILPHDAADKPIQVEKNQSDKIGTGYAIRSGMKTTTKFFLTHNLEGAHMKKTILLALSLLLVAVGCTKNPVSENTVTESGSILFKAGSVPSNVARIELTLTNTNTGDVYNYDVYDGMTVELPVGQYDLLAEAFDDADFVIYRGIGSVTVNDGVITSATIYMDQLSGEISFTFVWESSPA
jgi:hypothetical protein